VRIGSFEEYVAVVEQRHRDGVQPVPRDGLHGLRIGFYADYLGEWFDEFGDDLRIVFLEDLRRDPRGQVASLYGWLGIDTDVVTSLDVGARKVTEHPRSTLLAAAARTVKRRSGRLLPPAAQRQLQRAYAHVNKGGQLTEQFDPALRAHVEDLYRESNLVTAQMLAARGYRDLPGWLKVSSAA
jgi:hypothetical protein